MHQFRIELRTEDGTTTTMDLMAMDDAHAKKSAERQTGLTVLSTYLIG
jgi:hypothetical protein